MGNSKSKKARQKEPDKFFERERWKETRRDELKTKSAHPSKKRAGVKEPPPPPPAPAAPPGPGPAPAPAALARSYDAEALERMRYQLHNDSDAFLLNNILLSVQFFENFDRDVQHIKENPMSEREHAVEDAMVRHHKHVFFADRLEQQVHKYVRFARRRAHPEPLTPPRLFVIYDNIEACEPGDTSDYSAVLDAPFYKLLVEDCKVSGYVKLKKLEVLQSTVKSKDPEVPKDDVISDDSIYTDTERDSFDSDDSTYANNGDALLKNLKMKLNESRVCEPQVKPIRLKLNDNIDIAARRRSGPIKQISSQVEKSKITNIKTLRKTNAPLMEDINERRPSETEIRPRKSILKINLSSSRQPTRESKVKAQFSEVATGSAESSIAEETETSGYRSNSSSRNGSSETESDYGYATITESATPKPVELSLQSNFSASSGVLPDECWNIVQVRAIDPWSEDDEDEPDDNDNSDNKESLPKNLYDTFYYLSSVSFMSNFVDNFMIKLGTGLGISQDSINHAMTQGASVYCEWIKNDAKMSHEVIPALIAAWPNAANQWIIRERRIIQNPRTNFSYQWPTKYMVSKAIGFGCLLVPVGFRPKRGLNPEQKMQWRITFPAAERYLESCLAHSHIRCYLFTLALQKAFMENETSKIGIDASHIKNHLFWQCEDNYAKWPEDRLGETLRMFLKSFYVHFAHAKYPNYFMDNCNDFKSIPKPLLLKLQRRLADILEAPVMHMLSAVDNLKYVRKDFYPALNTQKLYHILTCKNPLRILNPNLPATVSNDNDSSDSDDEHETQTNFWERAKSQDKHYQWKKERQRQMQERRKTSTKKQKPVKFENEIKENIILPKKMAPERRRLVLEFFISHFIAMARSSEKFESLRQAVIYLEQAHRLCMLLLKEASGEASAKDYLDVIQDKLADCQRKLVDIGGFKMPRRESQQKPRPQLHIKKKRPKYLNIVNQDSPTEAGISAFTFVDVHMDTASNEISRREEMKLTVDIESESESESKL